MVSQQALANGAASRGNIQPIIYCHGKPTSGVEPVRGLPQIGKSTLSAQSPPPTSNSDDESSNMSNDSGCDADETAAARERVVKTNDSSHVREVNVSAVRQNRSCDTESRCSDMSLADMCDGSIAVENQEQGEPKQYKPRRKYYMYGNLKLVKPIKEVPKRFMDLLKSMSAEKSRVEGEPIILAFPLHHKPDKGPNNQFNPNAPTFVPGSHGDRMSVDSNHVINSPSSTSSNVYYCPQYVSLPNSNVSYNPSLSSVMNTHPQFHHNPLCTGFPAPPP